MARRRMGSAAAITLRSCGDFDTSISGCIDELDAEAAIEALDETVLGRFPKRNSVTIHFGPIRPSRTTLVVNSPP